MTDSTGTVVWKADYKPFGEESAVTGSAVNDKRFVGKEKDEETGLSYFGARYEDARIGRFTAVDPVRAVDPVTGKTNEKWLLEPQRLNAYAYGLNNPYRYVDPDGKAALFAAEDGYKEMKLMGGGGRISSSTEGAAIGRVPMRGSSSGINSVESPALKSSPYSPETVEARIKPLYRSNPAHDPQSPSFNPLKTPEPSDVGAAYKGATRGDYGTWYGKGEGGWYRFSSDNAGGVHFSGTVPAQRVPIQIKRGVGGQ